MSVTVRMYRAGDAAGIADLYRRSVEGIGPRDYSAAQVAAWASLTPDVKRIEALTGDGRETFIAADETDRPVGLIDLEADGHINFLYCAPEIAGQGVAGQLYDALEARAQARKIGRLYAEASEAARRFFLRRGFAELHRRELVIGDTPIHNYAVEKRLE